MDAHTGTVKPVNKESNIEMMEEPCADKECSYQDGKCAIDECRGHVTEDRYTVKQILDAIVQAGESVVVAMKHKDRDMLEIVSVTF